MSEKIKPKEPNISKKESILRFLKNLVLCIYPDNYQKFSQRRVKEGLGYFFTVLGISFIISLFAVGFKMAELGNDVEEELTKIKNLDFNFELEDDIQLKKIRIAQEGNFTNESILITQETINYKHWTCSLTPFCFGEDKKVELDDFESYGENLLSIFNILLVIIFIPLVLFYTIYNGLLALLLILIIGLIGKLITRNLKISTRQMFLIGIYASTIPLLLWPVALHLNLYKAPLILFILLSFIAFFIVGEKKHRY
ncbi:MAG: DUF1189 family protein [Nanoarchaeota archaeon]